MYLTEYPFTTFIYDAYYDYVTAHAIARFPYSRIPFNPDAACLLSLEETTALREAYNSLLPDDDDGLIMIEQKALFSRYIKPSISDYREYINYQNLINPDTIAAELMFVAGFGEAVITINGMEQWEKDPAVYSKTLREYFTRAIEEFTDPLSAGSYYLSGYKKTKLEDLITHFGSPEPLYKYIAAAGFFFAQLQELFDEAESVGVEEDMELISDTMGCLIEYTGELTLARVILTREAMQRVNSQLMFGDD